MPLPEKSVHLVKEIYALPEGELIDGEIYDMAHSNRIHQELVQQLGRTIGNYIEDHHGGYRVYPAPFAVFLNQDDKTYVEPDISVICDNDKLDENGLSYEVVQIPNCRRSRILDRESHETDSSCIFLWGNGRLPAVFV